MRTVTASPQRPVVIRLTAVTLTHSGATASKVVGAAWPREMVPRGMKMLLAAACMSGCASAGSATDQPDASHGDGSDAAVDAPANSPCERALAGLGFDFEGGAAGWTHAVMDGASAPGWPLDEWAVGTATSGPGSCHGGTGCWATRLDANYTSCERAALQSPPIDLSACSGETVRLAFFSWHDFWTGTVSSHTWFDGGVVEVSGDGTSWSAVTPSPAYPGTIAINPSIGSAQCVNPNGFHVHNQPGLVGTGGSWQQITIALPASVVTSTFRVRFAYGSGVSFQSTDPEVDRTHTRPGWYLDDVTFSK